MRLPRRTKAPSRRSLGRPFLSLDSVEELLPLLRKHPFQLPVRLKQRGAIPSICLGRGKRLQRLFPHQRRVQMMLLKLGPPLHSRGSWPQRPSERRQKKLAKLPPKSAGRKLRPKRLPLLSWLRNERLKLMLNEPHLRPKGPPLLSWLRNVRLKPTPNDRLRPTPARVRRRLQRLSLGLLFPSLVCCHLGLLHRLLRPQVEACPNQTSLRLLQEVSPPCRNGAKTVMGLSLALCMNLMPSMMVKL